MERGLLLGVGFLALFLSCAIASPAFSVADSDSVRTEINAAHARGDFDATVRLLRPLAEKGEANDQFRMGLMYVGDFGGLGRDDSAEAVKWFRKAAEQGHIEAQNSMGWMSYNGLGLTQNKAEAFRWWRKAAYQGHSTAKKSLMIMYNQGEAPQVITDKYARLLLRKAEKGDAVSQYWIGMFFFDDSGKYVLQDYGEAMKWFLMAAAQGHAEAQGLIGLMYAEGNGIPQDYIQAHKWWNLSAANGNKKAAIMRDAFSKDMTPDQIAEAQRLAREWVERR